MSKKQIKITQDDLRKLVRESIQDKLNGVFSTDDPKAADAVRNDFDAYDAYYGEGSGTKKNREDLANLIDKRANGEDAELDLPNYNRFEMDDELGDRKEEAEMYEKNPEGEENLLVGDPNLEEPDIEPYEMYEDKQVRLNEAQLREFVSYSVSRLLKEALEEEKGNKGTLTHFGKKESEEAAKRYPNPYKKDGKFLPYDEYCEKKKEERMKDKEKEDKKEDKKPNKAVTVHFSTKDLQEMVSKALNEVFDADAREYAFKSRMREAMHAIRMEMMEIEERFEEAEVDPDQMPYYRELKQAHGALDSLINYSDFTCVRKLTEGMGMGDNEEPVTDNFPKKAAGTFTMNTRRGNVDKYKVYVEKTDDEELLTDIFIYDPMDKEWYPQAEYVVGIEEYTNGTWLPYWETFNGDVSIRALANCFGKVVKLWKKVGYLYDEDDEIPFRYAGDIKGLNGKIY